MPEPIDDPRLDEQARREWAAELRHHRGVLTGLSARQGAELAAEATRHLDRTHEIMRALAARVRARAGLID